MVTSDPFHRQTYVQLCPLGFFSSDLQAQSFSKSHHIPTFLPERSAWRLPHLKSSRVHTFSRTCLHVLSSGRAGECGDRPCFPHAPWPVLPFPPLAVTLTSSLHSQILIQIQSYSVLKLCRRFPCQVKAKSHWPCGSRPPTPWDYFLSGWYRV